MEKKEPTKTHEMLYPALIGTALGALLIAAIKHGENSEPIRNANAIHQFVEANPTMLKNNTDPTPEELEKLSSFIEQNPSLTKELLRQVLSSRKADHQHSNRTR